MAIKINELELEITSSADEVRVAIDNLIKSLEKLQSVAKKVSFKSVSDKAKHTAEAAKNIDSEIPNAATKEMQKSSRWHIINIKSMVKGIGGLSGVAASATKSFGKLFNAIKRIALYRAIRTFIRAITSGVRDGVQNLVRYEQAFGKIENANYVMSELGSNWLWIKNSMGAVAVTILSALLPAIQKLVEGFVALANAANHFMSAFLGRNVYAKAKKGAYDYATALGAVKKQLFGFDELNVLNSGSGGASPLSGMFESADVSEKMKSFSAAIKDTLGDIIAAIKAHTNELEMIIGGALAGIGLIMCATGNIPLGVGLLAAGLASFAVGIGSMDGTITSIKDSLTEIMKFVGISLVAIGLIVAASGNLPLGIGLIVGGAATLGTAVAIDHGILTGDIKSMLTEIAAIIGVSAMAIGAALLLSPASFALGLGLIFGGAAVLGSAIAINPNYFKEKFTEAVTALKSAASQFKINALAWIDDFKAKIKQRVDAIVNIFKSIGSSIVNSLPSALTSLFTATTTLISGGGRGVTTKADGGVVPTGQLFIANEAGPELVGQVGNKTTVTNQDQFVQGLINANESVVQATLAIGNAIVQAINAKDSTIELDGVQVSRQIYKAMNNESTRRGTSLIQGA